MLFSHESNTTRGVFLRLADGIVIRIMDGNIMYNTTDLVLGVSFRTLDGYAILIRAMDGAVI